MKRFVSIFGISSCIIAAGILMSLLPGRRVAASNIQTVSVANPSLAVTQSGSWNVGISGTPTVNLGSAASVGISGTPNVAIVRDEENAHDAFQSTLCIDSGFSGACGSVGNILHVPLGSILVIDYISGECNTSFQAGSAVTDLTVGTNVGGHFNNHHFGNFNVGTGTHFATGTMTRLYSGPDSNVILGASFSGIPADPDNHCDVTISGHTVAE